MEKSHYDLIKSKWGRIGSWAIYDQDYGDYQKNFELIEQSVSILKPRYVFCALNSSRETLRTWETFHVRYPGGKGSILRDVFNNSRVFIGSYMTDLIKSHVNPRSGEVVLNIKANIELLDSNMARFGEELKDLGTEYDAPVIFAIGGTVQSLLRGSTIANNYRIFPLTHYSAYGKYSGNFSREIQSLGHML